MPSSADKPKPHEIAANAPTSPGVYQMLDADGTLLYIGKAKNLRKRLQSYFRKDASQRPATKRLMDQVADIQVVLTDTEKEALLLENNLIKKEKPRYNINLRDDKDYVCLRLSIKHPFPRLTVVRRPRQDGALYFGPYTSAGRTRYLVRSLLKLFPLRSCTDAQLNNRVRPCLLYQIKLCTAPCTNEINRQEYAKLVEEVSQFLKGDTSRMIQSLEQQMQEMSDAMDYEGAAKMRDRIRMIHDLFEGQKVASAISTRALKSVDVVGWAKDAKTGACAIKILFIRLGNLTETKEMFFAKPKANEQHEVLNAAVSQFYLRHSVSNLPNEILVPSEFIDGYLLAPALSDRMDKQIDVHTPSRGKKKELVQLANKNAKNVLDERQLAQYQIEQTLQSIKKKLRLGNIPYWMEAFDISNISGQQAVASKVVFRDGKPSNDDYRRYQIKTKQGPDDFAMMAEVIGRRFKNASELPDLILIDGGKGQLNAAIAALSEIGIEKAAIASIAKPQGDEKPIDRFFLPNRKNPVLFKEGSAELKMLQWLRNEAHRFAIRYHRTRRNIEEFTGALTSIAGVGEKREKELLKHFGSLERVKQATVDELSALPFLDDKTAQTIFDALQADDLDIPVA